MIKFFNKLVTNSLPGGLPGSLPGDKRILSWSLRRRKWTAIGLIFFILFVSYQEVRREIVPPVFAAITFYFIEEVGQNLTYNSKSSQNTSKIKTVNAKIMESAQKLREALGSEGSLSTEASIRSLLSPTAIGASVLGSSSSFSGSLPNLDIFDDISNIGNISDLGQIGGQIGGTVSDANNVARKVGLNLSVFKNLKTAIGKIQQVIRVTPNMRFQDVVNLEKLRSTLAINSAEQALGMAYQARSSASTSATRVKTLSARTKSSPTGREDLATLTSAVLAVVESAQQRNALLGSFVQMAATQKLRADKNPLALIGEFSDSNEKTEENSNVVFD